MNDNHDDFEDCVAEFRNLQRLAAPLKRRRGLRSDDPDALDDAELERLENLEDDMRDL